MTLPELTLLLNLPPLLTLTGSLLLTLAALYTLAHFVLERHELRVFRRLLIPGVLVASLLFWGAGALDSTLPSREKFYASLGGSLLFFFALRALGILGLACRARGLLPLLLGLASAALAVPAMLLAVYLYAALNPSEGFSPPPARHPLNARATMPSCPRPLPALHPRA